MALEITILPENETTIIFNETVHFTSTVTGATNGIVAYQWIVDGSNEAGADQSTFDFTPGNAGGYKVSCWVIDGDDNEDTSPETPVIVESEAIADKLDNIKTAVDAVTTAVNTLKRPLGAN